MLPLKKIKKMKKVEFSQVLDDDDKGKRMLYVMPESIGDIYLSTSYFVLLKSFIRLQSLRSCKTGVFPNFRSQSLYSQGNSVHRADG